MKAKLIEQRSNGKNCSDSKELIAAYSVIVSHKGLKNAYSGNMREVITVRTYMGRSSNASTVYASIWVHAPKNGTREEWHTAGTGSAGGYGYHKASAAIASAITSAGIELYGDPYRFRNPKDNSSQKRAHIGGCGDTAVEGALRAIVQALGYNGAEALISSH